MGSARSSAAVALLAIDWGTTSARAYGIDRGGDVVGQHATSLGLQQVAPGGFPAALREVLGEWAELPVPRIACGMVGSRQGWVEAPYQVCPVRLDALADGIVSTPGGELAIVGGLTCRDAAQVPDVMRGEETQIAGLAEAAHRDVLVVQPGTHSKWSSVVAGRIEAFATYMTGETFAVLRSASILGRMMVDSDRFDAAAFQLGASRGLEPGAAGELLHRIFAARTLALFDELAPPAVADYLSGLLIGAEVSAGCAWAATCHDSGPEICLLGAAELCRRYALVLEQAGRSARLGPADSAALGLWRIAQTAGLVVESQEKHGARS